MLNDLKDLNISYPFMPVEETPAFFTAVKNMRIIIELPAMQPTVADRNGDFITAYLTGIVGSTATVHVVCHWYGYNENIDVPIVYGGIPTGNNWMYALDAVTWPENAPEEGYRIHPACLAFQQKAPTLYIEGSTTGTPPIVTYPEDPDDEYMSPYLLDTDMIAWEDWLELENGHNVEVSGSSDSVVFTGAVGIGKGVFPAKPYVTDDDWSYKKGLGIRSINGLTGDVLILGERSVDVSGTTSLILDMQRQN